MKPRTTDRGILFSAPMVRAILSDRKTRTRRIIKPPRRKFKGEPPTLAAFAPRFLEYQRTETKPLTYELQETIVRVHIVPHLGRRRIDQLDKSDLDALKTLWTCAATTKNTRLGVAMRMLELAAEWGLIDHGPRTSNIRVPKETPRFLTEAEAAALIAAAVDRAQQWREMVIVALRTGMRIGELRGLRWTDIDMGRRLLVVRRTDPGRADMEAGAPKGNRPRTIPLTEDAIVALERARAGYFSRREAYEHVWVSMERATVRPRSDRSCTSAITALAARAGLDATEIGWHTLRHTFASWLVMRGVPLSAVQELLGHASVRQTEKYSHLAPGFAQHAAVAALDFPLLPPPALPPGDAE